MIALPSLERDRRALRWGTSLACVLAVHAVTIGVMWWGMHALSLAVDKAPMEAVMVELAPVPEAPPAPPTEIPPGPPQQEQRRSVPEPAPKPRPKLELPPAVDPEVPDPQQQEANVEPENPVDQVNVDQTLAPPNVQAQTASNYAAEQTVSGTQGQVVVTWQGLLLGHLEKHRSYPRQAERRHQEGVVYVRFAVDRKGNVSSPRIGRSSGHVLLDEETLATVRRASPVPPPPAEIPGDPVEVMVPVEFFLRRR